MTALSQTRNRATRDFSISKQIEWGNNAYDDPVVTEFDCPECGFHLVIEMLSNAGVPYHLIGGGMYKLGCPASFATFKVAKDGAVTLRHRNKPKE